MSWFNSVLNVTNTVAGWMEKNSTAASLLSGAVIGGAKYYVEKEAQEKKYEHEEKIYQRRRSDELSRNQASSGNTGQYQKRNAMLTGGTGLLTNGRLAAKKVG